MVKVFPTQVIQTIDDIFPGYKQGIATRALGSGGGFGLLSILRLVNSIPDELIILPPAEYSRFVRAVCTIEHQLDVWIHRDASVQMAGVGGLDCVSVLRDCLAQCPDEYPPPSTMELLFIPDTELRESIRGDVGAAGRGLQNAEWKAATVLARAAIEALLLWRLSQASPGNAAVQDAINKLAAACTVKQPRNSKLKWGIARQL